MDEDLHFLREERSAVPQRLFDSLKIGKMR